MPFPDGSDDPVNFHAKKLERLRLRNIALESELQDMHDQNELLEFRLLELEECQGVSKAIYLLLIIFPAQFFLNKGFESKYFFPFLE